MNREEVINILTTISKNYEYEFKNKTKQEKLDLIDSWYKSLSSYSYKDVSDRLEEHIKSRKYVPTISDLTGANKQVNNFKNYNDSNELSEFDKQVIDNMIKKYGKYMNMSLQELKAL